MFLLAAVLSVFFPVTAARAEAAPAEPIPNNPALNDSFNFYLGIYAPRSAVSASLTPPGGGTGVAVDFENSLGLAERSVTGVSGFMWRFTKRWRLEVDYFRLNRDASRTLNQDIEWNGVTYPIGTTVESTFDFYDVRASAGYSFFKTTDKELGVGIGLHLSSIKASINASGVGNEAGDVLAPLPVLSLYGQFALTDEWGLRLRTDWFSLTYGDYSGDLNSAAIDILYQPFRHVGFGFGVKRYMLDAEINATDYHGRARVAFNGPEAFVMASF